MGVDEVGLAVGIGEEVEVGCEGVVVVVMLRAEATDEDCAVKEVKAEAVVEVEEGEAGLE